MPKKELIWPKFKKMKWRWQLVVLGRFSNGVSVKLVLVADLLNPNTLDRSWIALTWTNYDLKHAHLLVI